MWDKTESLTSSIGVGIGYKKQFKVKGDITGENKE